MNLQNTLQATLQTASTRLNGDRAGTLTHAGLPTGLAFLTHALLQSLANHDDEDEVADLLRELVGVDQRKRLRQAMRTELLPTARNLDAHPELRAACQALIQALTTTTSMNDMQNLMQFSLGDNAQINQPTINNVGRDLHIHQAPRTEAELRQERALRTYLQRVATECNALPLDMLDATDGTSQAMQLGRVFVSLFVERQTELTKAEFDALPERERNNRADQKPTRPVTAIEALAGRNGARATKPTSPPRLMLLGKPGGGKSTFVSHLALSLARNQLAQSQPAILDIEGWLLQPLLPIRIILRDLAAFAPLREAKRGTFADFLAFLSSSLQDAGCADALEPLQKAMADGRALLLFDGLDEVVDTPLARVAELILDATKSCPTCPILTTCRALDYESEPLRQLPGFARDTLADLSNQQINHFIGAWYNEYAASGRRSITDAQRASTDLRQALAVRPQLHDLGRTPLLLTVMVLVHANKGTLPTAEALLYEECVKLLLFRWRQGRDGSGLIERLGLRDFGENDLLGLLARIAFRAHEATSTQSSTTGGPADLRASNLLEWLADELERRDAARKYQLAATILETIGAGNGLLVQRGPGVYTFPHRTFQEFLAGFALRRVNPFRRECLKYTPLTHWHTAIKLMVGYQVLSSELEVEKPLDLAIELLRRSPEEQVLAGELLNLITPERAASQARDVPAVQEIWREACDTLLLLATTGTAPEAPAALRVRAGLEAGKICYGDLAVTAGSLRPGDPRLLDPLTGNAPDGNYWCPIEPGSFWFGDDDEKQPLQQVRIDQPYNIARFPVTNAEYARFIADNGYNPDAPWWRDATHGRAFLLPGRHLFDDQEQPITLPRLWNDPTNNQPNQPVVAVSWYEASAYCRWLTLKGHTIGWLPTTHEIRLPTSQEWERAARHTDKRRFPWGDPEPTVEYANYGATEIGAPSPGGCFPLGSSVCGAQDMAGNVLEWLATPYRQQDQEKPTYDISPDDSILLTWSYYGDDDIEQLFCGARFRNYPVGWDDFSGFRVILSLRSSV
jgi:formylglycine-generating enzyme required for sulfatase activity